MNLPATTVSLSNLADIARTEHELCETSLVESLKHAINAGEALLQAKENVPRGGWYKWLNANLPEFSENAIQIYMRVARYQDRLPADIRGITDARMFLRGLPKATGFHGYPEEFQIEARRLRGEEGLSYKKIARELGVSDAIVGIWCDKQRWEANIRSTKKHSTQRKKERRALEQKELQARRLHAAKVAGGAIHDAYSKARLLGEALDAAVATDDDRRNQDRLRNARDLLFKIENQVAQVLGVS